MITLALAIQASVSDVDVSGPAVLQLQVVSDTRSQLPTLDSMTVAHLRGHVAIFVSSPLA